MTQVNFHAPLGDELEHLPSLKTWLAAYEDAKTGSQSGLRLLDSTGSTTLAQSRIGSCSVVFDGLLYNRDALISICVDGSANRFTDADLVAYAYQHWGEELLEHIKGIFAVIVWDSDRDLLLCARDRIGVYPLFYANVDNQWWFSTSIQPLTEHSKITGRLNRAVIADHLRHRWAGTEDTFFQNVKRVPSGHVMRVSSGQAQTRRYWELPIPGEGCDWIREDELEQFDELLDQAVDRCLMLGPAAIYLSGGLDSVSVAAIAIENSQRRGLPTPLALSLDFPSEWSEAEIQKGVAAELGLPQILLPFEEAVGSEGLLMSAMHALSRSPVPFLGPWTPAYHQLGLKGAQQGYKVVLTGGGGDEWLGVTPLLAADLIRTGNFVDLFHLWRSLQRSYPIPWQTMTRNMLWRFGAQPLLETPIHNAKRSLGKTLQAVAPGVLEARRRFIQPAQPSIDWLIPDPSLQQEIQQRSERIDQQSKPTQPTKSFYFRELQETFDHPLTAIEMEEIFESGNRMGMRTLMPYWDVDLITMLYRVPPRLLLKGDRSKGLVRDAMERRFPNLGFKRQKKVVATNFFTQTMLEGGRKALQTLGGTPALAELGIVDRDRLASLLDSVLTNSQADQAYRIWDVVNLEAWLQSRL